MHCIKHVYIENFRLCRKLSLPLSNYTPLVGQNNTGKTTILEAIRWGLAPSTLKESDFCDPFDPIVVALKISGVTEDLLDRIPESSHRKAIEPFCRDGVLWIRVKAVGKTKKGIDQEVWDVKETLGDDLPAKWRSYPTGLPQAVSVLLPEPLFIEAMDDVGVDLGKAKAGTTIKMLLEHIMSPVLRAHEELTSALGTIQSILSVEGEKRSSHLQEFDQRSSRALQSYFPGLELELDLQVVDIGEFFKAGDLHVVDKETQERRRFDEMGTGAQRAIQMALVQYLAELSRSGVGSPSRRLLLIDEPELYLHPQGVTRLRKALFKLSESGFQIVFATHSPSMLSRENAADTLIVSKSRVGGAVIRRPLRTAVAKALDAAEAQSRTLFALGNLAKIYFSEKVVLCEGKTDLRLLPLAYERLFGRDAESDGIAFLSLGSCNDIPRALPVLAAMEIPVCAIADLDFAFGPARFGKMALLPRRDRNFDRATEILAALGDTRGIQVDGRGLPKGTGDLTASEAWAIFADDVDGKQVVHRVHEQLKDKGVWVWPVGSLEDVTGHKSKGEDAILDQEEKIRRMEPDDLDSEMPLLRQCLSWIQS